MSWTYLLRLLKIVWAGQSTPFWLAWMTIAVAAVLCVARLVGQLPVPTARRIRNPQENLIGPSRSVLSRSALVALSLLGSLLVCSVLLSLVWEDFAYNDNSMFTLLTLKGHHIAAPIWRNEGRFFPLGHQEFNLIRLFAKTAVGYQALSMVELLLFCWVLLVLDDEISLTARAALASFVLLTPSIVVSFGGLVYTERNLVLTLACLVLFVNRFDRTQSTACAVATALCAQIMIYYKEPAFLLLLGFALGRLVLRSRANAAACNRNWLQDKRNRLDLLLAGLALLFLLGYELAMLPHANMQYAHERQLSAAWVAADYLELDLLAWVFLAVVLGRAYFIVRHWVAPNPLWDGLAFGGVSYFIAYLGLRMFSPYFLAPVDVIAILYLGRLAIQSRGNMPLWAKAAAFALLPIVLLQNISLSAFSVFERKKLIHGKAEIASVVQARYRNSPGNVTRIFLPFANPYHAMEFASYLNYRGVPVEGTPPEHAGMKYVLVVDRAVTKNGSCVGFASVVCYAGSEPTTGDLVIVLPDDDASLAQVGPYRDQGTLLFSYAPRPSIPQWLSPFVQRLHISPAFAQKPLPDRWLHASVTLWR